MFKFFVEKKNLIQKIFKKSGTRLAAFFAAGLMCFLMMPVFSQTVDAATIKTVVIGYYDSGNEEFQNGFSDDERKTGYAYDYYQELLKYTHWKYEYVYGSSEDIQRALFNGEVDIVAGIPKTSTLQELLLFPNTPMGAEGIYVYCNPSQQDQFGKTLSFAGQRIGVVENSTMHKVLLEYEDTLPTRFRIITYPDELSRNLAFENGEVRLIVASDNDHPMNTAPVVKIGSVDFYFAVSGDRSDLINDLNVAQTKLLDDNPTFTNYLQQKYFLYGSNGAALGAAEKQSIQKNDIVIGSIRGMMPYSDCDDNGRAKGLVATISEEITKKTGKEITVKFYDSYSEAKRALGEGDVSVIFPVLGDAWSAEQENIILSSGVSSERLTMIFQGTYNYEKNAIIAVQKQNSISDGYLRSIFGKDIRINEYDSFDKCMDALYLEKVDLVVSGSAIVNRYLSEKKLKENVQVVYREDELEYCFGIPEGQTSLYSVISKSLSSTDKTIIEDAVITNAYVKANYDIKEFFDHYSIVFIGILLLIVAAVLVFFITRNKNMAEYNKELNALNEHLTEKITVIREQKGFMRIDSLTQVNNRFRLEEYLNDLLKEYDPFKNTSLYMAIMDLDHFKMINDTYGHAEGDEALVATASALKSACNGTSVFLARFGGDEFVMICEADSRRYFDRVLEKIQPLLDDASINRQYHLEISIGVAEHKDEIESAEEFFKRADEALYLVKEEHHRNCVQE